MSETLRNPCEILVPDLSGNPTYQELDAASATTRCKILAIS